LSEDVILLELSGDPILLEDSSGDILLEVQPSPGPGGEIIWPTDFIANMARFMGRMGSS
jgi:hypothetical protein